MYFGGKFDKLKWMSQLEFDLLIIDESQEGVDTMKTERAFRNIKRKHTLYLSGTPFKQLASDQFSKEQIYNWSYADEQEAKDNWPDDADYNPYAALPKLSMFTYQLSNMIYEQVQKGLDLSGEDGTVDYAFDLNEFFITNDSGKFVHEDEIKKFLHALSTQEKYPYSTPELRKELAHTMWYLNRVASAKALAKLLHDDPVFKDYEVVIAAGDGKSDDDDEAASAAIDRVRKAIATHDKTITLTVGQLTVGISGRSMYKRPQFLTMMQDAREGKFDVIYTKSISRFGRNTVHLLESVRELRDLGIAVIFQNENINTLSNTSLPKGDFVVMKTGVHPMKVHLKLFFQWGIAFDEEHPYSVPEHGNRKVQYAEKKEIQDGIMMKYHPKGAEEAEAAEKEASGGGQAQHQAETNEPQQNEPPKEKKPKERKSKGSNLKPERHNRTAQEVLAEVTADGQA